ncbi:hypothetical protein HYR99_35460 [Candidatus Poribacteria bacterium]|nr:hypothetical protein [Candidatus Poribacteria bacterium]
MTGERERGRTIAIIGLLCLIFPSFVVLLGTILRMIIVFENWKSGGATRHGISLILPFAIVSFIVALIGLVFICLALFGYKNRERWFFGSLTVLSILWLLYFPFGTLLGVGLLIFMLMKRKEFLI